MFYGHADEAQTRIGRWWLIDLRAFRAGLIRHAQSGLPIRYGDVAYSDGTWFK